MFKIALAKTSMMCNLATELSETKRKKNKKEQGDFGLTGSPGSIKRLKKKKKEACNSHLRNQLSELTVKKYFGYKTAFPA